MPQKIPYGTVTFKTGIIEKYLNLPILNPPKDSIHLEREMRISAFPTFTFTFKDGIKKTFQIKDLKPDGIQIMDWPERVIKTENLQ